MNCKNCVGNYFLISSIFVFFILGADKKLVIAHFCWAVAVPTIHLGMYLMYT